MKWLKVIMTIVIVSMFTQVSQAEEKPPLSVGRIAGEIGSGWLGSLVGGAGTGYLLFYTSFGDRLGGLQGREEYGWTAMAMGTLLGSSMGVYAAGTSGSKTGSTATLVLTFLGSAVGCLVSATVLYFADFDEDFVWQTVPIIFLLPSIGGTAGFNIANKGSSESGTALINFDDGKISLGMPTIQFRPKAYVELVKLKF